MRTSFEAIFGLLSCKSSSWWCTSKARVAQLFDRRNKHRNLTLHTYLWGVSVVTIGLIPFVRLASMSTIPDPIYFFSWNVEQGESSWKNFWPKSPASFFIYVAFHFFRFSIRFIEITKEYWGSFLVLHRFPLHSRWWMENCGLNSSLCGNKIWFTPVSGKSSGCVLTAKFCMQFCNYLNICPDWFSCRIFRLSTSRKFR